MKIHKIASLVILFAASTFVLSPAANALEMISGNNVTVDFPVDDDVFATGNTVIIKAPVAGAVIAAGSAIIDAPIAGDLVVAGGSVAVNSDVGGKIVAVGGSVDLKGRAKNVVVAGGSVNINSGAVVSRDVFAAAGTVNNSGRIDGNLKVRAQNFENSGTAGSVNYEKSQPPQEVWRNFGRVAGLIGFLWFAGSLILGIVLLMLFPAKFLMIQKSARGSTLIRIALGFVLIIASVVFMIISAITIIGIPIALMSFLVFIIALSLANYFVAFALGKKITEAFKINAGNIANFIIGFVVLNVLIIIPFLGGLIQIIVSSLGFGAIYYALKDNWKKSEAK